MKKTDLPHKRELSEFTDEEIFQEAGRRMRARQATLPNPPVMYTCPNCKETMKARDWRMHPPRCPKRKAI